MADKQKAVDEMALAITETEVLAERACVRIGELAADMRKFRKDCDIHPYLFGDAYQMQGISAGTAGTLVDALNDLHSKLDAIREECGLPKPTPNSGGGGGK